MSFDGDHEQPSKRFRTLLACQNCRARKLSCGGDRPCARCRQEGRTCTDVNPAERTPLTRKRMTELEERLFDYDRIWNALHPEVTLDVVRARLSTIGLDATIREIKGVDSSAPLPQASHTEPTPEGEPTIAYPPTRPTSPHALAVKLTFDIPPTVQTASNEWNEETSPGDGLSRSSITHRDGAGATPSNDFGTGVRGGAGYLGLSSGATLLRAIQKFIPEHVIPSAFRLERGQEHSLSFNNAGLYRPPRSAVSPDGDGREALILPPADEIGPLVDAYFRYFHALIPIVHEPTIRAQITGALPLPTGSGSRVLFNMIFATGAFDSATDDALGKDGFQYYEVARTALQQDLLEGGSLSLVQGLAIMAIYLQRNNRPNAGYVCLGLAIRTATALGLHVLAPMSNSNGLSVLESEMRSRIWWGLVALEVGQCITYGRPHGISLPSLSTVRLPVNTDDANLTVSSKQLPSAVARPTLYTALITQAKLAQMAFHCLDRVSRSMPSPSVEQIKWCGTYFHDQLAALPPYMRPSTSGSHRFARAVQAWRARDFRSVLYRPVLLSAAWNQSGKTSSDEAVQEIVDTCRALALENLRDIAEFIRTNPDPHRGCEWYTLYFGIQASLTIVLSIVWEPNHPHAESWRTQIMETITWLRQLCSMRELATSYAEIMENALSMRPGAQLEMSTENFVPHMRFNQDTGSDIDRIDFERYFAEIWDGQTQFAGMTSDTGFGIVGDAWEDVFGGSRG